MVNDNDAVSSINVASRMRPVFVLPSTSIGPFKLNIRRDPTMRKLQDALLNKDKIEVVCNEDAFVAFLRRTTMILIDFVNVVDRYVLYMNVDALL